MGRSIILAAVFALVSGMAAAGHAISLEPEAASEAEATPESEAASDAAPAPVAEPASDVASPAAEEPKPSAKAAAPSVQAVPRVDVTFPSELDLYVVPAATRKVCTRRDWGHGEVEVDCRMRPVPLGREDPALRGLCVTRYGQRTCY